MWLKYRSNKIKQQHTIIDDIFPLLLRISDLETVSTIIPGRIKQVQGNSKAMLNFTVNTDRGMKLIAKSGRSVQEVFVLCESIDEVLNLLELISKEK